MKMNKQSCYQGRCSSSHSTAPTTHRRSMKMATGLTCGLFLAIAVSACGLRVYSPQQVTLKPTMIVDYSDFGKGKSIAVKVVDERDKLIIGRRGGTFAPGAEITTEQNVAQVVHEKLLEGLRGYNFAPVPFEDEAPVSLVVEVRLLEYSTSQSIFTHGLHAKSTLKAIAKNGTQDYQELYRVEKEEERFIVPTAETNAELINNALSEVINKLLQDTKLLHFLSSQGSY